MHRGPLRWQPSLAPDPAFGDNRTASLWGARSGTVRLWSTDHVVRGYRLRVGGRLHGFGARAGQRDEFGQRLAGLAVSLLPEIFGVGRLDLGVHFACEPLSGQSLRCRLD